MKKALSLLLTVAMLLGMLMVPAMGASAYTVSLTSSSSGQPVNANEIITLSVSVSGAAFNGMEATITYDPKVFTYVSGAESAGDVNATAGTVKIQRFYTNTTPSETTVAVLTFKANRLSELTEGRFGFAYATAGVYEDAGTIGINQSNNDAVQADVAGISVWVNKDDGVYKVTLPTGDGYTITPLSDPENIISGNRFTFRVTAKTGYEIVKVTANAVELTPTWITKNKDADYTLMSPEQLKNPVISRHSAHSVV